MTDVNEINKIFREYGRSLGSVESFTGGLFAKEITSVPGASHFYKGGLVTYATEEKNRILGIPFEVLDQFGVVSKETATFMATNHFRSCWPRGRVFGPQRSKKRSEDTQGRFPQSGRKQSKRIGAFGLAPRRGSEQLRQ